MFYTLNTLNTLCSVCALAVVLHCSITSASAQRSTNSLGSLATFGSNVQKITLGAILPKTSFITLERQYHKRLKDGVESLKKNRQEVYNFMKYYRQLALSTHQLSLNPSPTEILNEICNKLLVNDITTILYMTNWGSNAASSQYLLQLMGYLGIPVIAWNADNIGLEQRGLESRVLQLAPSVDHQVSAMLSILRRYSWHVFSIVTSNIGGHEDFVRAVREKIFSIEDFAFTLLAVYTIKKKNRIEIIDELQELALSEARVILLYSTKEEANEIIASADVLKLTSKNYMWIVTTSVLGGSADSVSGEFPPGMLGVHFNTTHQRLLDEIERAVTIFGNGLELFVNDPHNNNNISLSPNLSCNGSTETRWNKGDVFFKYLRSVSIKTKGKPNLEFNLDGTVKYVELDIMNLNNAGLWDKIGTWTEDGIEIKDITWPGNSPTAPMGVPEKFSLKVSWLEESPFVIYVPFDNETGECKTSRAVRCRYSAPSESFTNLNKSVGASRARYGCCSGFCIDLLQKFADDLKFTYELNRVEDGAWGVLENGTWNGLIADLLNHKADIIGTSIKINSDRQRFVDFTVPFLETGIAIAVAKRTGIISPKAFLEPFDPISWIMILLISIQVAAFAIFLFEWLSPSGYDMRMVPPRDHKFSLFRTYWLVWAILFGAAVHVDCPKGYTARFMANTWATFAVVFLAIYTANLAAFMITREEYYDFTGIEDRRLANPKLNNESPLRFGTIPSGNTEAVLKRNKPKMHAYMAPFNKSSAREGIEALRRGDLDAFIYDAVVLDHLAASSDCSLLTVGSWYAMTGYGFAMLKNSKHLDKFNKKMIEYREIGELERLRRFWFQGACKAPKNKRNISKPLDVNQFMSAFLLLGCGILLTVVLLALEHLYFRYCRQHLAKTDRGGCFTLVSLSMARSFRFNHQNEMKNSMCHCSDLICDSRRRKALLELELAKLKIKHLQSELGYVSLNTNNIDYLSPSIKCSKNELFKPRDLAHDLFASNVPSSFVDNRQITQRSSLTKKATITEIETVL